MYDMLKLISTQPPDLVNVPHAASASTSAEQDIADQFAIVAKPKLYREYSDGDDDYCPLPLDQYSEMGLIKSNVSYDDGSVFDDKEPEEDMSYYWDDEEKGRRGRKLTEGGPEKPDVSHLDPGRAAAVMKIWQTAQKKFTNSIATKEARRRQAAMKRGDRLSDVIEYTGITADLWRSMREVKDQPMCVNHTYPDKEILPMQIAEEANQKHREVSINRSDNHHVHANGRNGFTFVVRAYFGLNHGWRISNSNQRTALMFLSYCQLRALRM